MKFLSEGIFFKFAVDQFKVYSDDGLAGKAALLELKGLKAYANISPKLKSPIAKKLRFPFMVLINYLGYRILATPLLPINKESTLIYGSSNAGETVHSDDQEFNALMIEAASFLGIKEHGVGNSTSDSDTSPLKLLAGPVDIEGHKGLDGRYYLLDTVRRFPFPID